MTKRHGHEKAHAHCEHCLHFCGHCDVVYCCDCKIEWGKCHHTWPYYFTYGTGGTATGIATDTPTVTNTYGISNTTTAEACSHVHN